MASIRPHHDRTGAHNGALAYCTQGSGEIVTPL